MFQNNDGSGLIGGKFASGSPDGQALKLDTSGNLLVSTLGNTPATIQDIVRYYTMQGQAFSATTGRSNSPAAGNVGFQLFNPANSGKNILIYSLLLGYNSANWHAIALTTQDVSGITGWTNTPITPVNNKIGSLIISVATSGFSNTNVTGTQLGTVREITGSQNNLPTETLTNGECIFLPAQATIGGVAIYLTIGAAASWFVNCGYIEF